MDEDIAVKVQGVYKNFNLPHERLGSLKSIFLNIGKRKKRKSNLQHTLRDVSFEVKKGEFFGIVGRNGSGKSTLLKIIAEIYQPTKGQLHRKGRLVPFIELGVGFNPELTGRENVYLNGALLGFSTNEIDQIYDDIVQFAELEKFMDQKLKNYSSGMQVRLAFSVATRARADILLIDEVLAVGDAAFQRKCFNYFKELKKNRTTVIFVSHDMGAVREYCDRAILIENGRLALSGDTEKISAEYEKLFIKDSGHSVALDQKDGKARWGTGDLKTIAVDMSLGDDIVIRQEIKSGISTRNPIVGFRIRDGAGKEVLGTNTKIEKTYVGEMKATSSITVEWRFPNVFADGEYGIDPSIILADGVTTTDWWNDAVKFTINKSRRLPYNIDPGFQVSVKALEK